MRGMMLSLIMGLAIPITTLAQVGTKPPARLPARPAARGLPAQQPDAPAEQTPAREANSPPIIYVKQRSFRLPITISNPPFRIVAIQLHVSTDQGRSWRMYAQQPVDAKHFVFETPQDGEFWFASKTVDDQNMIRPGGPTRVEQRIIVDSALPQLEFGATISPQGEIQVTWRATDTWLDPNSIKLEYQPSISQPFQTIQLPASAVAADRDGLTGKWQFRPDTPSRAAHVRMEISDRAGNRAASVQRVYLPRVAGSSAEPAAPAGDQFAQRGQPATIPWPTSNQLPEQLAAVTPQNQAWTAATRTDTSQPVSSEAPRPSAPLPGDKVAERNSFAPGEPAPRADAPADARSRMEGPGRLASTTAAPLDSASEAVPGRVHPSVAAKVPAPNLDVPPPSNTGSAQPSTPGAGQWPALPDNQPVRMTMARHFQLDYDVQSAVPNGIKDIELWATQDGGRTWERWGSDADRQSPFEVKVDADGLYGFRVVVVTESGLASDPPYSGSPADLWVGVDNVPPTAEITAVVYGTGARMGELDIRWQADDQRLLDRPITLSFSDNPNGPWTAIAAGLPNSGQYYWRVDRSVPRQVYLRLQVADEAGNAADFTIREPINTEGLIPKGRIHSLIPVK